MKNIAVFFGGESVEHDISIITGVMTLNSLDKEKYNAIPVYVSNDGEWFTGKTLNDLAQIKNLQTKKLDRVCLIGGDNSLYIIKGKKLKKLASVSLAINCMHGERGEDGCIVGALAMSKIPFASPDILPSSVCIDKRFTKIFLKGLSVKCLPFVYAEKELELENAVIKLGFPMIVKPNKLGSSIGIRVANNEKELKEAFLYAKSYGEGVIIEKKISNFIEINCAGYMTDEGIKVSECEQPVGRTEVLSFGDKYEAGNRVFPADIDKRISDRIKDITKKIYLAMGAEGVIRIDFFLLDGKVIVNEINTVPGSLSYYLFGDTLKSFTIMLNEMISRAEKKYNRSLSVNKKYNSSILSGVGYKSAKRL